MKPPYAQMQIGMAHYRQMEKPDRDRAEAVEAEGANSRLSLQKYPNSPLDAAGGAASARSAGDPGRGRFPRRPFLLLRGVYRAAGARLMSW